MLRWSSVNKRQKMWLAAVGGAISLLIVAAVVIITLIPGQTAGNSIKTEGPVSSTPLFPQATASSTAVGTESGGGTHTTAADSTSSAVAQTTPAATTVTTSTTTTTTIPTPTTPPPVRDKWEQQSFVLSSFFTVGGSGDRNQYRSSLRLHKEAGLNLVELTFLSKGALLAALDVCEELQLPSIAQDQSINGVGKNAPAFTDSQIRRYVEELSRYRYLEGYYVWDEPTMEMFSTARRQRDLFKQYAPGQLAFSCVFPSYGVYNWSSTDWGWENSRYAEYVSEYLKIVDPEVLSLNHYPFGNNGGNVSLQTHNLWRDMGLMRRKALELGRPYWHYYQLSGNLDTKESGDITPEKVAVQMYAGLAYGVKGLSAFATCGGLVVFDGVRYVKGPYFDQLAALNRQVLNLGNELFNKQSTALYHPGLSDATKSAYFCDDLGESELIAALPGGTVAGVFTGGGKTYLMLVNKDYQRPLTGTIRLKTAKTVREFQAADNRYGASSYADRFDVTLGKGEGKLFALE